MGLRRPLFPGWKPRGGPGPAPGTGKAAELLSATIEPFKLEEVRAALAALGRARPGRPNLSHASTALDFFLQLMVSAATASIVSAALAERIKLWPFLIFTIVLTGLIDPIQASWTSAGGFRDFAGSTVVHPVGGWAALAGAIILGPPIGTHRKDGKVHPMPGSNLALATLGSFNPWLCWFGFSGGSQRALGPVGGMADASRIFSNTNAAAADGAVAALIGGVIEVLAVPFLDKMKLDGVLGEIPVHLFADIWGTIAVVLTNPDASFVARIVSILVAGAFFFVVSAAVWPIPKATMGLLVSEEAEVTGLDTTEPGMAAHPEFAKG